MMIVEKILKLEGCLDKINAPVIKYLTPGIEKYELETVIKEFVSIDKIPEGIIQLYHWHGGTNVNNDTPVENFYIFPPYYLISPAEIRRLYELNDFDIIENKMLPICSSGKGEYLTVDLSKGNDSKVFCLEPWNPGTDTFTPIYDNLSSMLDTVITCYEKHIFYMRKGMLEMDFDKAWAISENMNPNSEFWKEV